MKYFISIRDNQTGDEVDTGIWSPYTAAMWALDAYTTVREGLEIDDLALEGLAIHEDGETRPLTPAEEAAMCSALEQFNQRMADIRKDYP